MRDEKDIRNYEMISAGYPSLSFYFGGTTIVAKVWVDDNLDVRLDPIAGDQVACGEWYDLTKEEVAAYCKLLEAEIKRRKEHGKPV